MKKALILWGLLKDNEPAVDDTHSSVPEETIVDLEEQISTVSSDEINQKSKIKRILSQIGRLFSKLFKIFSRYYLNTDVGDLTDSDNATEIERLQSNTTSNEVVEVSASSGASNRSLEQVCVHKKNNSEYNSIGRGLKIYSLKVQIRILLLVKKFMRNKKLKIKNLPVLYSKTITNKQKQAFALKSFFLMRIFASWYLKFLITTFGGWRPYFIYYPFLFIAYLLLYLKLGENNFKYDNMSLHVFAASLYLILMFPFVLPLTRCSKEQLDNFFRCYANPKIYPYFEIMYKNFREFVRKK